MRLKNIIILAVILAVLGALFFAFTRPGAPSPAKPKFYVWMIEQDDIERITISLPRDGLSQSWIKIRQEDKFPWYFDDEGRSPVDSVRWGGGIPLLLSGPGADRVIADNATEEKLAEFGLMRPSMEIVLLLSDNYTMKITVGDNTPDGNNFYVRAPNTNAVATVDYTWYSVLAKLVKEPPYATPR